MRYAILFHDVVVGHSAFEQPNVLLGIAEGCFHPTVAFERLRPLLPAAGRPADARGAGRVSAEDLDRLSLMSPIVERLPLRVADADGRLLNARVCGLAPVAGQLLVAAWINDAAFWRAVAES